jgi:F1F0 ATPase subunit 2
MSHALELLPSFCAGALLGFAFFWGLWLTIEGLAGAQYPARRLIASFLLRFGVAIIGFYLLASLGGWDPVLAGVTGFVLARCVVIRRTRSRHLGTVGRG